VYDGSSFAGNKIFSYKTSTLTADTELGFGLSYQNISNVGDILFEFNLLSDTFRYKQNYVSLTKNTDTGFVKIIYDLTTSKYANGWRNNLIANVQPIIRIYAESQSENTANSLAEKLISDMKQFIKS
jgi:phosphomannomutase